MSGVPRFGNSTSITQCLFVGPSHDAAGIQILIPGTLFTLLAVLSDSAAPLRTCRRLPFVLPVTQPPPTRGPTVVEYVP